MLVMYIAWLIVNRRPTVEAEHEHPASPEGPAAPPASPSRRARWFDIVDTASVDLHRDEYKDDVSDLIDDQERDRRLKGRARFFWKLYYLVA